MSAVLSIGEYYYGNLPNITGEFYCDPLDKNNVGIWGCTNVFESITYKMSNIAAYSGSGSTTSTTGGSFDASRCSSIYANIDRVIPACIIMNYCIKY